MAYSVQETPRPELTTFLLQADRSEDELIGQKVAPLMPVKARSGTYWRKKIASGQLLRSESTLRNQTGTYNEVDSRMEKDTYDCEDRGLEGRVDDVQASEFKDILSLEKEVAADVRSRNVLDYEREVVTKAFDESVFQTTIATGAAQLKNANVDTVDIPALFDEAIQALKLRRSSQNLYMVLSLPMLNYLRRCKLLQSYLYADAGETAKRKMISEDDLAKAFRLKGVYVGGAGQNKAAKGKEKIDMEWIWPTSHIFIGSCGSGELDQSGALRTLTWKADVPSGLWATETYRDAKRRSDMLRVRSHREVKVADELRAQLIRTGADF